MIIIIISITIFIIIIGYCFMRWKRKSRPSFQVLLCSCFVKTADETRCFGSLFFPQWKTENVRLVETEPSGKVSLTIALLKTVAAKEVVSQSIACEHKLYCVTKNVSKTGDVRSCFNDADTQVLARQQLSKKQTNKQRDNK